MIGLLQADVPAAGYDFGQIILTNLPWIVMLVIGFVLVVVEMYMPGFGVPGVAGILLLAGGIILLSRGDALLGLVVTIIIVALLCVMLTISIRSVAKGRLQKSQLVLNDVFTPEATIEGDMSFYVGKSGQTLTVLRPAGIGEFEGVKLNVVSDGGFIDNNVPIRVVRVDGNRIVVRAITD